MNLDLVLLSANHLPALTVNVMKKEAAKIWAREGVQLTWRDSDMEVASGSRFLRLTLMDDESGPPRKPERYILGDYLRDEGRMRISLFAASQTATDSLAASQQPRDSFEYPLALGYVLGRAVAHEVGHALLGRAHTVSGLMAASFSPAAMADATSAEFRLTRDESVRVARVRVAAPAAAHGSTDTGSLSFSRGHAVPQTPAGPRTGGGH